MAWSSSESSPDAEAEKGADMRVLGFNLRLGGLGFRFMDFRA